jgi:NADH dehydrogenase FAD-containing subunit
VTAELVRTATRSISYDILVLATGIEYPIFLKDTTNIATIRSGADLAALSPAVANATRVLIIGGGLIGTELAAEFATRTPDKKTTIIHSQPRLLERMPPHLSRYAHTFLTDRNVTVITGEKVVDHVQGTFVTDRGRRLAADIAFWCAGIKANPYFMASLSPSIFSTQRTLRVNRHLQLEGYPTIFVGGDVASIDEEKTAAHAERHSSLIASNILRMQRNRALHSYHSRQLPMDVSLGAWDGILSLPPLFLVGFLPGITKHLVEAATLARLR